MRLDSLVNRGDYFSAHYLAEVLPKDLKKKDQKGYIKLGAGEYQLPSLDLLNYDDTTVTIV